MHRGLVLSILFFLTFSVTNGQVAAPDCGRFTGGTFIKGNYSDSIVVFRGIEYWIEADLKAHECRVYKIRWKDACNFILVFSNRIDENTHNNLLSYLNDTLFYNAESYDSNEITYRVGSEKNQFHFYYQKLRPFSDSLAWEYLVSADSNLYFDTTEIKQLYGMPLQKYYYNTPSFINIEMDSSDTYMSNYVAYLLKTGDLKPAFSFAAPNLKAHSPPSLLDDYNTYLTYLLGKLKSYTATGIRRGYKINKRYYSHAIIMKAEFEKLPDGASICISTAPGEKRTPLLSVSVSVDSAGNLPFTNNLFHTFISYLKNKKYHTLYDSSSTLLKSDLSFPEAKKTFQSIDSSGHFDNYKVFFQNFSVIKGKGLLLISSKCLLPGKTFVINLYYVFEGGKYKLSGLNSSKY
ncbi:MAG TPA: hypothetical protein VK809_04030 [Bacteroidia bacterium]|jgi:hypothetical protein|nr:hypothetical protein [Bacteroidia bacterium]